MNISHSIHARGSSQGKMAPCVLKATTRLRTEGERNKSQSIGPVGVHVKLCSGTSQCYVSLVEWGGGQVWYMARFMS